MGQDKKTLARLKPTLPVDAPRVLLTAVAEHVTISTETTKPVTLIGSRRDCDLSIGNSDVSKLHCALVNTGARIIVTDLCTRSGTFVNGQPVSIATLRPADELRVGSEPVGVWFPEPADNLAPPSAGENEADLELQRPLRISGAGQSYELVTLPAVIGRRSACQIVLDTPDVSLAHALLFAIQGRTVIYDLGSRSGTYLNGQRVGLAWLGDGDELSIGGEKLSVTFGGIREVPPKAAANADPAVSFAKTMDDMGAVLRDAAPPSNPRHERLGAEPTFSGAPERGSLAALSHREAALDEREARLAAAERELARKQAALAERETANAEALTRIAAFLGALSEAWRAVGFGPAPATKPAEPNLRRVTSAGPEASLVDPASGGANRPMSGNGLPAPLVDKALFPNLSFD